MALAGNVKRSRFLMVALGALAFLGVGGAMALRSAPQAEIAVVPQPVVVPQPAAAPQPVVVPQPAVASEPAEYAGLPDYGKTLLSKWQGRDLGSSKAKDVSKGQRYKINVYQDAGHSTANRAKVDLDRDDKWDEKWTFEPAGGVTRKVAPGDDENYTVEQRWVDGAWE